MFLIKNTAKVIIVTRLREKAVLFPVPDPNNNLTFYCFAGHIWGAGAKLDGEEFTN